MQQDIVELANGDITTADNKKLSRVHICWVNNSGELNAEVILIANESLPVYEI